MKIAILLYDGYTSLDAIGPFEVLRRLPYAAVTFVSTRPGPCPADSPSLGIVTQGLDALTDPDVLVVPGGSRTWAHLEDESLLRWLREADATSTWTTSVCTGSLLLGAAGLLRGKRATSHFYELESLRVFGAEPVGERVVRDGKLITAAGVSAGIDMALQLCDIITGPVYTQAVQLGMEYDPQPPYDSGSVRTAPPEVLELVTDSMRAGYGPPWQERVAAGPSPTGQPA